MAMFSIRKKLILFFLIAFSGASSLLSHDECSHDNTQVQNNPAAYFEDQQELWENQLQKILIQFGALDTILEDLALVINNDQVKKVKNKRVLTEAIKSLRISIDGIRKETFIQVDPGIIYMLNHILDGMVQHVSNAIALGFTELTEFNIEDRINRAHKNLLTLSELNLDESAAHSESKIAALDQQAKNVGLSWHNKTYRKLNDLVIQPSIKYQIPQRVAKVGGAAFLTWFMLWWWTERGTRPHNQTDSFIYTLDERGMPIKGVDGKYLEELAPKRIFAEWECKLRDYFGAYPHWNHARGQLDDEDIRHFHYRGKNPVHALGSLQMKWYEYKHEFVPLASAIASYGYLCKNDISDAYKKAKLRVREWHNKMLGGAYATRPVVDEDEGGARLEPKITFDDLVGMEYAKEVLSLIVKYIEDPERWDRGRLTPEKGYLLTGPTRTGKSYMAEALCGEIKRVLKKQNRNPDEFGFYVIKAAFIEQHGIDGLLDMAKREAPCVLFIDEIDLLKLQRANGDTRLLNQFLLAMSGALDNDPKKQVIILAATNRPENMDEALKQPGRFGKEIRFEYPNFNYRKTYLLKRLAPLCVNLDSFDLDKLALETAGCSFEQLNTLIKVAFQKAKIFGYALTQELLERALDSEIRRIRFDETKDLPEHEKQLLAVHQAGHALASMLLKTGHHLTKVTIRPIQSVLKEEDSWVSMYKDDEEKQKPIEHGKMFTYQEHDTLGINSKEEMLNICKVQLAGHAAEEVMFGSSGYRYHKEDKKHALQVAKAIACEGLDLERLPKDIQNELFDKAFTLLNVCKNEVKALLEQHKDQLALIAKELQKQSTLTAKEIKSLIQTGKIPTVTDAEMITRDLGIKEENPNPKTE